MNGLIGNQRARAMGAVLLVGLLLATIGVASASAATLARPPQGGVNAGDRVSACALTVEIVSAPYAVVDSNMPGQQGPQLATLGLRLINNGSTAETGLQIYIGDGGTPGAFSAVQGGKLQLASGSVSTYQLAQLAAGEERGFFWPVAYPFTEKVSYPYTIWAETANGCKAQAASQLTTQRELSASANKLLPTGSIKQISPNVVTPGSVVTVRMMGFDLGTVGQGNNGLYDAWLQPVGNLDFDPTCLRLIHSEVLLNSIRTTPYTDQLYFTNLRNYRSNASDYVAYRFLAFRECTTVIQPYQEAASGTQQKYNGDYETAATRVTVTSSGKAAVNLTMGADKAQASAGETVQFAASVTTLGPAVGDPTSGLAATVTVARPTNSVYQHESATKLNGAQIQYSTDGGQSWSVNEPTELTAITHLRWVFAEPLQNFSQTLRFAVTLLSGSGQCLQSRATVGLITNVTLATAEATVNCVATPTPTPTATPIKSPEMGVQSGSNGGLESGPLPQEPSAFLGGTAPQVNDAASNQPADPWHKARLLAAMSIGLEEILPETGPAGTIAKPAVPVDVLAVTNAPEAKAVDFVDANGQVQAVALGILTVGAPYEHDYGVCNRFKDYRFDTIEPHSVALPNGGNGWFWHSSATKGETIHEEALLLHLFVDEAQHQFHVDSRWTKDAYPPTYDYTFDYILNLQLWSNELAKSEALLQAILGNLAALDNGQWQVIYHNQQAPTAPQVYVNAAHYQADEVTLALWNATDTEQSIHLHGAWRSHLQRDQLTSFSYELIAPPAASSITLFFPGLLDATIYVEHNGFVDKIYQGGGLWFLVNNQPKEATPPTLTLGTCADPATIDTRDLLLAGCAEVDSEPLTTVEAVGIGRTLNPNGRPVDISPYQALRFWAKGNGTPIRLLLETADDADSDYYQTVFTPDGEWRQYLLPISAFSQRGFGRARGLAATQVKAVLWLNATAAGQPLTLAVDQVSFTNDAASTALTLPQDTSTTAAQVIALHIAADTSVQSVQANYSVDGGNSFQSVMLSAQGADSTGIPYRGTLPGQPLGTDVLYYLETHYANGYISRDPVDAPRTYYRYRVDDRASLLIDDFGGQALRNRLDGENGFFTHPTAGGQIQIYRQAQTLRLAYDVSQPEQYAGYFTKLPAIDGSAYTTLDLLVRSSVAGAGFKIGFENAQGAVQQLSVGDFVAGGLSREWQWVQVPLDAFAPWLDLHELVQLDLVFANGLGPTSGQLAIQEMRLTTLPMAVIIDNFDDDHLVANARGMGYWQTAPGGSINATLVPGDATARQGKALRLDYTVAAGSYALWNSTLKNPKVTNDAVLRFWVKGSAQTVTPYIYLADSNFRAAVKLADYVQLSAQWQAVAIPLQDFAEQGVNLTQLDRVEVVWEYGMGSGTLWLDNLTIGATGALQVGQRLLRLQDSATAALALHLSATEPWQANSDHAWLAVTRNGVGAATVTVTTLPWLLPPGQHSGRITISSASGATATVAVTLTITAASTANSTIYLPLIAR